MIFKSLVVGPLEVNCFLMGCEESREGIVVDPGENPSRILELIAEDDLRIVEVVATHGHFDHIARCRSVMEATGAPLAIHHADRDFVENLVQIAQWLGMESDPPPEVSRWIDEGDTVRFGRHTLSVIHTPGHAPGNVTLTWPGHAIVGDTLFSGSIGRTDLEGGNLETLMASIRDKLLPLGDDTNIYPGHGQFTTIGQERRTNPFLTTI